MVYKWLQSKLIIDQAMNHRLDWQATDISDVQHSDVSRQLTAISHWSFHDTLAAFFVADIDSFRTVQDSRVHGIVGHTYSRLQALS